MPGIRSAGDIAQPDDGPLDPDRVRTNFVIFRVAGDRGAFLAALRARNVLMVEYPHGQVRAVTHHDVTASDIETVLTAVAAALAEASPDGSGTPSSQPVVAGRHRDA
jgi:threonine aldolase